MSKEMQKPQKPVKVEVTLTHQIHMHMDEQAYTTFKAAADANRLPVAEVISQALEEWLDERS